LHAPEISRSRTVSAKKIPYTSKTPQGDGETKDMLAWGGAGFAQSLRRLGLVDEYRLILQPVALGDGLPLFKDLTAPPRLELVDAQTYDTGAALHIYRPRACGLLNQS
jgi:dihydrofolate reductase